MLIIVPSCFVIHTDPQTITTQTQFQSYYIVSINNFISVYTYMFILPTYSLSLAYSYLSSVISDISESKLSAVTVVKAEATVERERGEKGRGEG